MKYKGYTGSIEYSSHDGCFYGKIENIEDLVNYEGQTLEELKNSFHEAVDDYIEFCKKVKESKEKNEITMDEIWNALQDGDDTKEIAAGLVIGDLIARIISERHEQGMSQAGLARKMGVSVSRISRMENLTSMPRIDIVIRAVLVLGFSIKLSGSGEEI